MKQVPDLLRGSSGRMTSRWSKPDWYRRSGYLWIRLQIRSRTAFNPMLLAPEEKLQRLSEWILQTAMEHHLGRFGDLYCGDAVLFSFSTFLGILYARCNVAYLFEITGLHRLHTKYWRL